MENNIKFSIPHWKIELAIRSMIIQQSTIKEVTDMFISTSIKYWGGEKFNENDLRVHFKKHVKEAFYEHHGIPEEVEA